MATPPGKRGRAGATGADGFERKPLGAAWKSFSGARGQRLLALLKSFAVSGNAQYPLGAETSLALVRDILRRIGMPLPALPPARLLEWLTASHGGRALGWREVKADVAQLAANDGRPAIVLGADPEVSALGGVICPSESSDSANPTVVMVTPTLALDPGTVRQGFGKRPVRYFANG